MATTSLALIMVVIISWLLTSAEPGPVTTSQPTATTQIIPTPLAPIAPAPGRQRLYKNVPIVTVSTESIPIEQDEWLPYLLVSLLLAAGAIGYFVYVQRARRIPEDQPPSWHEEGPRYFPLGALGGEPAPIFAENELDELADSMGYFLSEEPSAQLNVATSIQQTMRHGGVPSLAFHRRHTVRSLLILEDAFAEATVWNPIAEQLAAGMARRGIEIMHGCFFGSPGQFRLTNGPVVRLEDLEEQRHGYVVLIFSDGFNVAHHEDTFALEELSRWPMVAWLDLRELRLWNATAALPTTFGIPLFPATPTGTLQAIRRFLTEQGTVVDYTHQAQLIQNIPSADNIPFTLYIEEMLGDAFPWAQTCALFQPVSPGLADALRRQFYPALPVERTGRLYALPNTRQTVAGLYFSEDVVRVLRTSFFARCNDDQQEQVLAFLESEIACAEPADSESIAHLAWQAACERVRLELDQDAALERLAQLAKTPVGEAINDSFRGFGFRDEQTKQIPLRLKPDNKDAWQRLARITDNFRIPRLDKYPVSIPQWSVLSTMVVFCIIATSTAFWNVLQESDISNWKLVEANTDTDEVFALLQRQESTSQAPISVKGAEGPFRNWQPHLPLQPEEQYQLAVYEVGYQSVISFTTNVGSYIERPYTEISVKFRDDTYSCVDNQSIVDITIYRCAETEYGMDGLPISKPFWRDKYAVDKHNDLTASIGIEFSDSGVDDPFTRDLHNVLLDTEAVDIVFSIPYVPDSLDHQAKAFTAIAQYLGPMAAHSQALIWFEDLKPNMQNAPLYFDRVDILRILEEKDLLEELERISSSEQIFLPLKEIASAVSTPNRPQYLDSGSIAGSDSAIKESDPVDELAINNLTTSGIDEFMSSSTFAQTATLVLNHLVTNEATDQVALRLYFTPVEPSGRPFLEQLDEPGSVQLLGEGSAPIPATIQKPNEPIYITFLLDASGSMASLMGQVQEAAVSALEHAPGNAHLAVIQFNDVAPSAELRLQRDFTTDRNLIAKDIRDVQAGTNTPTCLYNATDKAIELLRKRMQPQEWGAVILFTDGRDERANGTPCSNRTIDDVTYSAVGVEGINIPVHTIGLCTDGGCGNLDRAALTTLAKATNGFSVIGNQTNLDKMFQQIMEGLNSQWLATATVFPRQGKNDAVLNVHTSGQSPQEFTTTFFFNSTIDTRQPAPPAVATIDNFHVLSSTTYEFSVSVNSPDPNSIEQVIVQTYNEQNVRIDEKVLTLDDLNRPIQLNATGFANGEHTIQVKAVDLQHNFISNRNKDGEFVLADWTFTHQIQAPLFTIRTVDPLYHEERQAELVITINVSSDQGTDLIYEGFIRVKDGGGSAGELERGLLKGTQIVIPLPEIMRNQTASAEYTLYLTLRRGNEEVGAEQIFDFTNVAPQSEGMPSVLLWILLSLSLPFAYLLWNFIEIRM